MKFSIVLSTQPASFSALAYKGKLTENIAKIKALGYDGVELAVRDPKLLNLPELTVLLKNKNLPVPAIGTGQAFGEEGLSFMNPDPTIARKSVERIKSHIELADTLNAIVIIGLIRGKFDSDLSKNKAQSKLIEALQECALVNKKIKLAIEPINRYETNIVNTVSGGLEIIEKIKMDNVGLLLDTFHMNIEEPSIIDSIIASKDRLFHFHVADSNRWYPGAGHIDFISILQILQKINYAGFVSAEILPMPDSDTAAEKTIENLNRLCLSIH